MHQLLQIPPNLQKGLEHHRDPKSQCLRDSEEQLYLLHSGNVYTLNIPAYAVHCELEVTTKIVLGDVIYFLPQELLQGVIQFPGSGLACGLHIF